MTAPEVGRPEVGPGSVITLDVGPVAHGGHCVARFAGRVVFVRHTLPGETVRAVLTEAGHRARFWRADAVEVLQPAGQRRPSACPLAGPGRCGGCDWQHVDLEHQRRLKAQVIAEQLTRLAGLPTRPQDVTVESVPGDSDGLAWRTRVRLHTDPDGRAGLRRYRSHDVVALADCPLAHPGLELASTLARQWPPGSEVLVTGGDGQAPTVEVDRGGQTRHVSGPRRRRERAAGRTWRVTGAGFWQVHPGAADVLVQAVREVLQPVTGEHLLDLYSGVGLFAGAMADDLGPAGRAHAVEADPTAVRDARRNLHDLRQVRLVQQRVDRYLRSQGADAAADLMVLDPPRSGAGRDICRRIAQLRPRVVAYVACDPAALARDLATFRDVGYTLSSLRAFDLFPMTYHVECVAQVRPVDGNGGRIGALDGRMVAGPDR